MRANKRRCLLLLLILLLCLVPTVVYYFKVEHDHFNDSKIHRKKALLDDVFKALSNVVEFLSTDIQEINMDGLYGYRICQGSLIGTLKDCLSDNYNCPDQLVIKLGTIIERLNELGHKALPYVEEMDAEYYNNYLSVLSVPFIVEYVPETLGQNIQPLPLATATYNGRFGDKCFGGLMGTLIDDGRKSPPCTVVDGCWEMMTVKGTLGYFTTHQLLYTLYAEHSGCSQKLEDRVHKELGLSLREWQRFLCEQIYLDARLREYNRQVDVGAEDLFLEQIALCGILGFQNFFNETWIQMVLTWQNPRGCFTMPDSVMDVYVELSNNYKQIYELEEQISGENKSVLTVDQEAANSRLLHLKLDNFKHQKQLVERYESINKARGARTGRSLMTEAVMGSDCLSHKTGVGAATLGSYARYLVSQVYGKHKLPGIIETVDRAR